MRAVATAGASGSAPRSKRCEASVCIPSPLAVLRMLAGSQYAASSATTVVVSPTSLAAPPITPARARALLGPATTPASGPRVRSTPSRVMSRSPSRARRTLTRPSGMWRRSKAWVGWPISIIT